MSSRRPQNLFAARNVVHVFQRGVLPHPTADACDVVSAKLTAGLLGGLDTQVAKAADADTVAHKRLSANAPP
ncbi:hypothetical protein ACFYZE_33465 [Streptomyces sp. NPDC001796]|uniref:hypothetical protein n=1 Tax=Streptomyces sp. NPDC001796 TaxID=3364609 RepID=UPI0036A42ABA